ncbi:hypothetical protein SteCoe_29010 [Stentor coeruleus]|uniref:RanBP2-type domain-containing protein n=1 Tax=Stentor coeruleus TaxID=5963 RepID=A0A1R2B6Z4_9CILI|nr:hypothetical protein SteCoe_29010 [Stentor coeruleus]
MWIFKLCQNCEKLKPGLKGWICNLCKVRNPSESNIRCKECYNFRNSVIARGQDYWSCKKCKAANSVLISICGGCGALNDNFEKPKVDSRYDALESKMWTCTKCKNLNSVRYDECIKCQNPNSYVTPKKEPQRVLISNKKPAEEQYLNEIEEKRDYLKRPLVDTHLIQQREEIKNKKEQKYLEWKCTYCFLTNEGKNPYCSNCRKNKTDNAKQKQNQNSAWTCPKCNYENMLEICVGCCAEKPAPEKVSRPSIAARAKRCSECSKELSIINCPKCKKPTRISEACIYCSASLAEVKKCYSCEDGENLSAPKASQSKYSYLSYGRK